MLPVIGYCFVLHHMTKSAEKHQYGTLNREDGGVEKTRGRVC